MFEYVRERVLAVVQYLSQQQPLWLQFQLDLVPLVVQELLQLQVLQSAQGAVIPPVHSDLHLPGLNATHSMDVNLMVYFNPTATFQSSTSVHFKNRIKALSCLYRKRKTFAI